MRRALTMLAGLWLALAVVHAPPAPSSSAPEWSAAGRLPDGAVLQRIHPVRPLAHIGPTAILPAPIVLASPLLARSSIGIVHARSFIASRSGNLGARAPPA
jgi:hypothetical protein